MDTFNVFQVISAGGDIGTVAIAYVLLKHHTRLTVIETKLIGKKNG